MSGDSTGVTCSAVFLDLFSLLCMTLGSCTCPRDLTVSPASVTDTSLLAQGRLPGSSSGHLEPLHHLTCSAFVIVQFMMNTVKVEEPTISMEVSYRGMIATSSIFTQPQCCAGRDENPPLGGDTALCLTEKLVWVMSGHTVHVAFFCVVSPASVIS